MSTVKSTYDDPALASEPIARDRTWELLDQVMGLVAISIDAGGLAKAADWDALGTGETYVGYGRGVGRDASPAQLALITGRCRATGPSRKSPPLSAPPAARSRSVRAYVFA